MKKHQSYTYFNPEGEYDAIVIGSGMGGLTVASLLSKIGRRVLVLERHYTPGGFTHTFKRKGFEWDVGLHYVGEVTWLKSLGGAMFHYVTDGKVQWEGMGPVYDKIVFPDKTYEFRAGPEEFKEQMYSYFPEDKEAIDKYLRIVPEVASAPGFFIEKIIPPFAAKLIGGLLRKKMMKYGMVTTKEMMDSLSDNDKLKAVLVGQFGDYGMPPSESAFAIQAMVSRHYLYGGFYPVGGSSVIAEAIIPQIEAAGGAVVVNAEVEEIVVEKGAARGVKMKDGKIIKAKKIVSDAGFHNTHFHLVPRSSRKYSGLLPGLQPSIAHVCLYVGLDGTDEELGLLKPNLWIYPGYDHDLSVKQYLADMNAKFPVVYISFPSAKDPSFGDRFPGRSTLEVIAPVAYEWFEKWRDLPWKKRGEEYEAFKAKFTERLLDEMYRQLPQLKGKVLHAELSTPLSTAHFANYSHGELYGLNHGPERWKSRELGVRTHIKGLFMTGQDVVTCGIVGALMGGALCAVAMERKNFIGMAQRHAKRQEKV